MYRVDMVIVDSDNGEMVATTAIGHHDALDDAEIAVRSIVTLADPAHELAWSAEDFAPLRLQHPNAGWYARVGGNALPVGAVIKMHDTFHVPFYPGAEHPFHPDLGGEGEGA